MELCKKSNRYYSLDIWRGVPVDRCLSLLPLRGGQGRDSRGRDWYHRSHSI